MRVFLVFQKMSLWFIFWCVSISWGRDKGDGGSWVLGGGVEAIPPFRLLGNENNGPLITQRDVVVW